MQEFIARWGNRIVGTLSGFDRLVLRGSLPTISYAEGMRSYLDAAGVLLKDFGSHVQKVSDSIKSASVAAAIRLERPVRYLPSSRVSKEEIAREILEKDRVDGLICVLSSVEPCKTFDIHRNRDIKMLELVSRERKCLFLYHYWNDRNLGFMSARIQTWFPFQIQVCLNGREWLGRQMEGENLEYLAAGNCFPFIKDWEKAQELMNAQLNTNWPRLLDGIASQLNPIHETIFKARPIHYYWTTHQSEWAIDTVFRNSDELKRLYRRFVQHGMTTLGSVDVMRYLGKPVTLKGEVPKSFRGEATSTLKSREEGVRIKHVVNGNSVKLYDKAFTAKGSVLRAETTLQNGSDLRVFRPKEGDPKGPLAWRPMRRGVADLHRRAQLSEKAAQRYLDSFASIDDSTSVQELVAKLQKPASIGGRRVRALRPFDLDRQILAAIARAEFTLTGFRNRDLQDLLFDSPPGSPAEQRRRSSSISRLLRILRAHGVISKTNHTHRYQLTAAGRQLVTAILSALRATTQQLSSLAA
jgi:hypothetical protein